VNLDARARASAQAIDRSATLLDPVADLDDLLRRRRRQPLQRAAAAGLALLVLVVAIWAGISLHGPTPLQPTLGPVTRLHVGPRPVSVAVTPGAAWILNSGDHTIARVDPRTGRVQASLPFRRELIFATVADGRLWVVHAPIGAFALNDEVSQVEISAIDPSTNRTVARFGTGMWLLNALGPERDLAVGSGAVWVAVQGADEVTRFDAVTGKVLDRIPSPKPTAVAVDGQTLWVATADARLHSIDIGTGAARVRATTDMVTRIQVGQGGVWLMTFNGKVLHVDRRTGRILAQVPGTFEAADLAVGAEGVWVYDQHQGTVLRIDPGTNRVVRTIPVTSQPLVELHSHVLALGAGAVWVVDKAGEAVVRVDPYR
jgi:DNA-binding beta-propeller fold protein YncE